MNNSFIQFCNNQRLLIILIKREIIIDESIAFNK